MGLIVAIWLWHEFVVKPVRLIGELCERAGVLEMDKTKKARTALDEMNAILPGPGAD